MKDVKTKIKAIIFDMDDTIISSANHLDEAMLSYLHDNGYIPLLDKQLDFFQRIMGLNYHVMIDELCNEFELTAPRDEIAKDIRKRSLAKVTKETAPLIEGFTKFHDELRKTLPSALATNAPDSYLSFMNKLHSLETIFGKHLYNPTYVNNTYKPEPDLFLFAAQQLGVRPEECVVFEDTEPGFAAAKAAGMRCIAVKHKRNLHLLSELDGAIDDYHQAIEALNKLT